MPDLPHSRRLACLILNRKSSFPNCRALPGRADVEFFTIYLYLISCGREGLGFLMNPHQGMVGAISDY